MNYSGTKDLNVKNVLDGVHIPDVYIPDILINDVHIPDVHWGPISWGPWGPISCLFAISPILIQIHFITNYIQQQLEWKVES